MSLTKKDIVEQIHIKTGFPKQVLLEIVTGIFDSMKKEILTGNNVKVSNFGTFKLRDKRPRPGRNMQTGEKVEIRSRSVVSFKASRALRDVMNKG